jgi:hypothetical protein
MAFSLNNSALHDRIALMRKTMNCRLRPAKHQKYLADKTIEICRPIYNQMIAYRTEAWEQCQESLHCIRLTYYCLSGNRRVRHCPTCICRFCKTFKNRWPILNKASFRRVKTSETPNCPQTVQQLVNTYSAVAVEELQICNMLWNDSWRS